jgi:uncharacterized membrane protein
VHRRVSKCDRPDRLEKGKILLALDRPAGTGQFPGNLRPGSWHLKFSSHVPEGATMSDLNPSGLSDNAAGGIAYITIIPAIVFLIMEPFKRISYVRFHAWQSIFFFVAWAVVHILVGVVQNLVPSVVFLTLTLWQLVDLAFFVVLVIVFVSAFNGKRLRLPIIGGLAERQANR